MNAILLCLLEEYLENLGHHEDYWWLLEFRATEALTLLFIGHLKNLRVFELADSTKLLALNTTRIVWIALDLLLSASDASNR